MATTLTAEQFKKKYGQKGINAFSKPVEKPAEQKKPGFFQRIGEKLSKRGENIKKEIGEAGTFDIKGASAGYAAASQLLGGVSDIAGETFSLTQIPQAIGKEVENMGTATNLVTGGLYGKTVDKVGSKVSGAYNSFKTQFPSAAKALEATGEAANFAMLLEGGSIGKTGIGKVGGIAKTKALATKQATKDLVDTAKVSASKIVPKATEFLASEPSPQLTTALKQTPKIKFETYNKIAQEASTDATKPSVFEKVGDSLTSATEQIEKQTSSLSKQKAEIVSKAKNIKPFTDQARTAILETSNLPDSPIKKKIISRLKGIKTTTDADKVIDLIQQDIYEAGRTNVIASGSKFEKQMRGILGKMNESLKKEMPSSYRALNAKISNRIKVLDVLNRSLGEVVEGVPIRGASLVKQFFSPAGSKTKELFAFIKKNTGVDLAQEATLAKYFGEIYSDPKVRSLLEGIPTGRQGLISKGLDILAEKSGLAEKANEAVKQAALDKARKLLK